jgi:hypothetical protein
MNTFLATGKAEKTSHNQAVPKIVYDGRPHMNGKAAALLLIVIALVLSGSDSVRAAATWVEDPNPVFGQGVDGGPKAYYPSILYDSSSFSGKDGGYTSTFKMWYDNGSKTGLATSDDGYTWTNRTLINLDYTRHATVEYYPVGFTGVNSGTNPSSATMYYRMWYWYTYPNFDPYGIEVFHYTESADGITWYNDQPLQNGTVPIVTNVWPDWNRGTYGPADILYNPGAPNSGTDWVFTMYYDGTTGGVESIGLAFSADGITWTGYDKVPSDGIADPVLEGTLIAGDWDYDFVSRATVIKNPDGSYEMWYSGGSGKMDNGIGYATSLDGITWARQGRVYHINDNVAWRSARTYCPMVIRFDTVYKMWLAGTGSGLYSIGTATGYSSPTAVALSSFTAIEASGTVILAWTTTSEIDNVGFNLYRSEQPEGGFVRINPALIPSQSPGSSIGADYNWTDHTTQPGMRYFYKLEVVDIHGKGALYGPASVDLPASFTNLIYLPLINHR